MIRSSFKRPARIRPAPPVHRPIRAVAPTVILSVAVSCPKESVVSCEPYRRLVAAHACRICGISGYSQAAHPNTGKGAGIKTDDRLCFALCTVHPGADGALVQGCHEKFDQGALFTKAVRQSLEPVYGADTRRQIISAGEWPKNLQKWEGT